ncbi:MAG: apolipoprotein N-acyltransferase [Chlamydiae bacterium]|nr:apolipoprotein N-acyltransferase [Chlamydiota bacterium]
MGIWVGISKVFYIAKARVVSFAQILLSWVIVAFGVPAWSPVLSLMASLLGYALFWSVFQKISGKKQRAVCACLWFMGVQAIQLSWMTATAYHGFYIILVYLGILVWFGVQFGCFTALFPQSLEELSLRRCLFLASFWVLMEWSRLFFLCGFPFNFCGVVLAAFAVPSQLAAFTGVLGLSFIVIFCNLLALRVVVTPRKMAWYFYLGTVVGLYVFGSMHWGIHRLRQKVDNRVLNAALVQTGLRPEEKVPLRDKESRFVSPFLQWYDILNELEKTGQRKFDLIVLPEAAVPFGATQCIYPLEEVNRIFLHKWGQNYRAYLPLSESSFLQEGLVSNSFWAQSLANYYGAQVVVGFDDYDKDRGESYNAAFYFAPYAKASQRYEKCILVPLGEYLPFSWLKTLVAKYGVVDFATPGVGAKVFGEKTPIATSVCYEECFGHFMRQGRKKGAQLFVNITNDGWYLPSKLPEQHFYHARLRSIENGVPLVRACNTGVTAAVDSLNTVCGRLNRGTLAKGVLTVSLPLYHYRTPYSFYGDYFIVGICCSFIGVYVLRQRPWGIKLKMSRKLSLVKKK